MSIIDIIILGYMVNIIAVIGLTILMFLLIITEIIINKSSMITIGTTITKLGVAIREKRKTVSWYNKVYPMDYSFFFPFMYILPVLKTFYLMFRLRSAVKASLYIVAEELKRLENL